MRAPLLAHVRAAALPALLAALATGVAAARSSPPGAPGAQEEPPSSAARSGEAEALAPPGRWTTEGGCAARTGHSLSAPLRDAPVEAWTIELRGALEGEPRVWDGVVTLAVHEAASRRALQRVELATGRTLLHQVLPASTPLAPAAWDDRVAVRPSAQRVDVYRVRAGRLFHLRTVRARRSVSAPLVVDGALYLRVDDALARYEKAGAEPVWRSDAAALGGVPRGEPAARGDALYALVYDARGGASVVAVSLADGRPLARAPAGHHGGDVPEAVESALVAVLPSAVFVEYPRPVPSTEGTLLGFGRIAREVRGPDGPPRLGAGALHDWLAPPTPLGDGWLARERHASGPRWIESHPGAEGVRLAVLADAAHHADLAACGVPAAGAGDVVYVGGAAFDRVTHDVLWRRSPWLVRPVPVDGTLLVAERERSLTALRAAPPDLSPAEARAAELAGSLDREAAERYAALAHESLALHDPALTRRLVREAVARGARGRMLDAARDGLERLRTPRRASAGPDRRRDALLAKERAIRAHAVDGLLERARRATDRATRIATLAHVFEREPENDGARGLVAALVPDDAPALAGADARSWLDFLDVEQRTPVRFTVDAPGAATTPTLAILREEALRWRDGLVAWESSRLRVVTAGAAGAGPGAVARCLEIGELVCDVLEETFGAGEGAAEPMTLLLFATREEYVAHSRASGSTPEAALGWTAGHYSTVENLSRMYVPPDDRDLEHLLGVYVHELTHHWLATRAPFASRASDPRLPFWVVEGFATMVEELRLDPRAGTWDSVDPRAESLDVVANSDEADLVPWGALLRMDHPTFARLEQGVVARVPLTWRLGVRAEKSEIGLYYAQASALCHWLFEGAEADRAWLLDAVEAWYRLRPVSAGRLPGGRTAEEVGQAVLAFARARTGSDGPAGEDASRPRAR